MGVVSFERVVEGRRLSVSGWKYRHIWDDLIVVMLRRDDHGECDD